MDIQVASNFERYLYYLYDGDVARVRAALDSFSRSGRLTFSPSEQERVRRDFAARCVTEPETMETIAAVYGKGYLLDPHTAVGVKAGVALRRPGVPLVCLATAHPAKFGAAVARAIGREPELPPALAGLSGLESRCQVLPAEVGAIKEFVAQHAL